MKRILKKAAIPKSATQLPLHIISETLRMAYKNYYKKKGSHSSLHNTALEQLAEALATQGKQAKEIILNNLRMREKQRATARKIRVIRGKLNSGSTTMVMVQLESGESIDLASKKDIELAIMKNNEEKYQQSFHTPFLQFPLRGEFGFKGLTEASQAVLAGVYDLTTRLIHAYLMLL